MRQLVFFNISTTFLQASTEAGDDGSWRKGEISTTSKDSMTEDKLLRRTQNKSLQDVK